MSPGGPAPVRVGNAAKDQVQYDGLGLLVEAVSVYVQTGGRLDAVTWRLVRELADFVVTGETGQPQPSNSIWEQQDGALLIDGDIGRWLVRTGRSS
ncbi:MAG: glycoside hydrolase family 15 protein [Actinomycetota bacterium]|nr:glycoside hydrolase family 15 protein [Actinomycetota bacterium]